MSRALQRRYGRARSDVTANRVLIYVDNDLPIASSLKSFIANNETLTDEQIATLRMGGVVTLGGGAAPRVRVYGAHVEGRSR